MKAFVLSSLICISLTAHSTPQTQDDLKRISMMIVQGKPGSEILSEWKTLVTGNPKMEVDKAINTIRSTASQESKNMLEAARKKTIFYKTLNEQIGNEINSVRPVLSRGETAYRPIPRKSFSLNPDAGGRVVVRQAGTVPDPKNLSEYVNLLEQQKSVVLKNIQTSESEEEEATAKYNQSVETLAGIVKQMHDDAMKILDNLKG